MAKKKHKSDVDSLNVEDYRHSGAKRKNNPPAKIAAEGTIPPMPKIEFSYSPRRPPVFASILAAKPINCPNCFRRPPRDR